VPLVGSGWLDFEDEFQGRGWRCEGSSETVSPHGELVQDGFQAVQHHGILYSGHPRRRCLRPLLCPHHRLGSYPIRLHSKKKNTQKCEYILDFIPLLQFVMHIVEFIKIVRFIAALFHGIDISR